MSSEMRKKKVLEIVIREHMDRALPVGSNYVSRIMGLSSATIRNIMGELEDEGYLEQPHTSAGRIPTERAYRHYVNSLLDTWEGSIHEIRRINRELFMRFQKYNELVERTSYVISRLTGYTSFVIYPSDHIYLDGAFHMLEQPEFSEIGRIKKILRMLDEKERMLEVINAYLSTGALKIHIGRENSLDGFEGCSIVTSSYSVRGKVVGGLGIIGPIRMQYRRVVPLVKYISESVSRVLDNNL
ncbi:MAG: hypothetical protein ABH885_04540 [Candidatus Omnitrophota bacterium]